MSSAFEYYCFYQELDDLISREYFRIEIVGITFKRKRNVLEMEIKGMRVYR